MVKGAFTLPSSQKNEIVMVRHNRLELWKLTKPNNNQNNNHHAGHSVVECIHTMPLFTKVFDIVVVPTSKKLNKSSSREENENEHHAERQEAGSVDYIAITSETGYLTLLRYHLEETPLPTHVQLPTDNNNSNNNSTTLMVATSLKGTFVKVSEVQLGRSGARLSVPGAKLCVDPQGDALLVTSLFRAKMIIPIEKTNVDPSLLSGLSQEERTHAGQKRDRGESDDEDEDELQKALREKNDDDNAEEAESGRSLHQKRHERALKSNIDRNAAYNKYFHKGVIKFGNPIEFFKDSVIYSVCALEEGVSAENCSFVVLEEDLPDPNAESEHNNTNNSETKNENAFLRVKPTNTSGGRHKNLVVYSFSFSLRQVTRSHRVVVPSTAHKVVPIPGGAVGPGGVLLCTDTELMWYDLSPSANNNNNNNNGNFIPGGVFKCSIPLPRRVDFMASPYDPSIIASAVTAATQNYFLLLQDEQGDLFRIDLEKSAVAQAHAAIVVNRTPGQAPVRISNPLKVVYFDTIPVASAMLLFSSGVLLAAAESAPHHTLYRILQNGYTDESKYITKKVRQTLQEEVKKEEDSKSSLSLSARLPPPAKPAAQRTIALYAPHRQLKFLQADQLLPNTPAVRSFVPSIGEEEGQQVAFKVVGGRGGDSALVEETYGYVVQTERRIQLPTPFIKIMPLPSANEMRRVTLEHQKVMAEVSRQLEVHTTHAHRVRLLNRLLSAAHQGNGIGIDKLLLCTAEGTVCFKIGERVEPDTLSGFVTSEETLAATTLQQGRGYVQVTRRGVHVLRAGPPPSHTEDVTTVEHAAYLTVNPSVWTHPNSKPIVAASVTGQHILLALGQRGGLMSFHYGHTGTDLQALDTLPTFPPAVAVSLLHTTGSQGTAQQLQSLLFNRPSHQGASERGAPPLAAVGTASQEVYLLDSARLSVTLDTVQCTSPIESILLTHLGGDTSGGKVLGEQRSRQRLFCFVGHSDGNLTRIEIDPLTYKQIDVVEVSCGTDPCRVVLGDGQSMCYVQSGPRTWRCSLRRGVVKVVPWVFPFPRSSFARFVLPNVQPAERIKQEVDSDLTADGALSGFLSLDTPQPTRELVIGVYERDLAFFSVQQSTGETTLEYSLSKHTLPVAGRQVLQHPTRRGYFIILGNEHRGYGRDDVRQQQEERSLSLPYDGPHRSLGHADRYSSAVQLFHEPTHALKAPYYFGGGEAAITMAVGSFLVDFGKEPVIIVSVVPGYTHGAGCGKGQRQTEDGVLRVFHCVAGPLQANGTQHVQLERVHATTLKTDHAASYDFASALHICEEVGLLFVGMGKENGLRVYSWGKSQLLRKAHLSPVPDRIVDIKTVFTPPPPTAQSVDTSFFASDLYRCPADHTKRATQGSLLIVCATVSQSIFVAAVQAGQPSYLLQVAVDSVPRALTCISVLDERTFAAADRFGHVIILRLQARHRLQFSEPLDRMRDTEVNFAEDFIRSQPLEEVAVHQTGQLVTQLHTVAYNPTHGADPSLNVRILFYATTLGAIGAYTPLVTQEEGAFAAYLRPLLQQARRVLVGESGMLPSPLAAQGLSPVFTAAGVHHVVEGDLLYLLRQSATDVFSTRAKANIEEELQETALREARQRQVLGLPPRTLPVLDNFLARQRALVTLPQ
ncbi:splicing factor 3B subunit 3 [Angomonas deanei]|uniref:Mono-functional DNA-alkylating methyl methanesulfonate N-term/CPSF A subunit region containing protein, putative n=1 Tax=Angomonas deanei TaxID=59799 RepID=A0A7G2CSY0_9TRYP|nr:splicing factor 3B subunit 3 [Angomonas deanei]CAD2222439.1 Mono-functional DNA-alkylating methyl methanesulfonate N-term/CPSF A subunit region containing protein, putative [Angomonas deanei]|eukprot:EPY29473.1 splicing factor 3B subunit 3 [Angomonas deanei]